MDAPPLDSTCDESPAESPTEVVALRSGNEADRDLPAAVRAILDRIGLRCLDDAAWRAEASESLALACRGDVLELREPADRPGRGVRPALETLRLRGDPLAQARATPLVRAIGRAGTRVIDATLGLGGDAALMAIGGLEVLGLERNAVLHALVAAELHRLEQVRRLGASSVAPPGSESETRIALALGGRLRVENADAIERLRAGVDADVVLLDPMYPPKRRKGALPPRAVRTIARIVGSDPDQGALFDAACASGARRVVVKRPRRAEPLGGPVHHAIEGKLARFDVTECAAGR